MATINDFNRVFNAYPAEITAGRQGGNMSEIESIIKAKTVKNNRYSFLMQDGDTWLSQFSNNRNITPELAEQLKTAEKGETWKFEYVQEGSFKNITGMLKVLDVRADDPTPAQQSDKDKTITYLALYKALGSLGSGNLQCFVDKHKGDLDAAWTDLCDKMIDLTACIYQEMTK